MKPRIILCAGRVAAQNLLKTREGLSSLRETVAAYHLPAEFADSTEEIPLLATYHPSAILRDEALKRPAWEDLKLLKARLG